MKEDLMGKYGIIFYQKDNGRIPVQEFLDE